MERGRENFLVFYLDGSFCFLIRTYGFQTKIQGAAIGRSRKTRQTIRRCAAFNQHTKRSIVAAVDTEKPGQIRLGIRRLIEVV